MKGREDPTDAVTMDENLKYLEMMQERIRLVDSILERDKVQEVKTRVTSGSRTK